MSVCARFPPFAGWQRIDQTTAICVLAGNVQALVERFQAGMPNTVRFRPRDAHAGWHGEHVMTMVIFPIQQQV